MTELYDLDIESFAEDMVPVLCQGWLWKKKQRGLRVNGGGWQKRWFVADNHTKCLTYCKNKNKSDAKKRSIPFAEIKAVHHSYTPCAHSGRRARNVPGGSQFSLLLNDTIQHDDHHNEHRKFILQADSPEEIDEWVSTLKNVSLAYNQGSVHHFHLEDTPHAMRRIARNGDSSSSSEEDDVKPAQYVPPPTSLCFVWRRFFLSCT